MKPQLLIACDFDGTVTREDTLVEILDKYGSPHWRDIQRRVVSGELPIRRGLQSEMETVRADMTQLAGLLAERVELDPTFPPFLQRMRRLGVPVVLLSGGFDLCVEIVLRKTGLWPLPYLANRLRFDPDGRRWVVEFPFPALGCEACGHCKGDPIRNWNRQGFTTVFAGNGVTDRCGAEAATLAFAKEELADWCGAQGVAAVRFTDFTDVERELQRRGWL